MGTTQTSSVSLLSGSTQLPQIGYYYNNGVSEMFDGWIDELRVIKGLALYTSNFTPPSAAFPRS